MFDYVTKIGVDGKTYNVMENMWFNTNTPIKVMETLVDANKHYRRIRVFYGDVNTGKDWCETFDTIGYIGKSTGQIKIPLLVKNSNSCGGGAVLDGCIVKITIDKHIVYRHPTYHLDVKVDGCDVYVNGELHSTFTKPEKAVRFKEFLQGTRNSKA